MKRKLNNILVELNKLVMWLVVLCQRFDSKEDRDYEYWRNRTLDQITEIEKELNKLKLLITSKD